MNIKQYSSFQWLWLWNQSLDYIVLTSMTQCIQGSFIQMDHGITFTRPKWTQITKELNQNNERNRAAKRRRKYGQIGAVNNSLKTSTKGGDDSRRRTASKKRQRSRLKKTASMGHKNSSHSRGWRGWEKESKSVYYETHQEGEGEGPTYIGYHLHQVMGWGLNETWSAFDMWAPQYCMLWANY